MKRAVPPILFWGGLWGLAEAVLGHGLHLLRFPGLAGWVMFPVGFWMMSRALRRSGRTVVLAGVPAVAATVKLADFLLPIPDPFLVLNPAAAILIEGAAIALLLSRAGESKPSFASLAAVSTAWRAVYYGWGTAAASLAGASNLFAPERFAAWRFFALDPLVAALLIDAAYRAARTCAAKVPRTRCSGPALRLDRLAARPAWAAASVVLAAAVGILLRRG